MRKIFLILAALMPAPALAAELWCMPETMCRPDGSCKSTTDEESSLRLHNMKSKKTTMRSHVETIPMERTKSGTAVEWRGTNERGGREYVIWASTTGAFTYTVADTTGDVWKSNGYCEVQ